MKDEILHKFILNYVKCLRKVEIEELLNDIREIYNTRAKEVIKKMLNANNIKH